MPGCARVEHVIPRALGGHSHVFNAFLMEEAESARFGAWFTREKASFVGEAAVARARTAAVWSSAAGERALDWDELVVRESLS